ncbi:TRAP transporter permease [Pseudolabrys sp.]|uniref:TRAP transporter permease n=1 Tax=Pseudolabrys sp. TaxID=1960880 RepID=UPI003D0A8A94
MTDVEKVAEAPGQPIPGQTKTEAQLDKGWSKSAEGRALFWIAVAFSAFQVFTAMFSPLASEIVRSVHVGFLMVMVFGVASTVTDNKTAKIILWALGILGFVLGLYHWVFYEDLILRAGEPNTIDIVVGVVVVVMVFEAGRRMMGPMLPIICAIFLSYGLFGQYFPSPLNTRGYDFGQVVDQMFLGTEGIYGIPVYVSSTYIFLFILFGAFLEKAGMINLFNDIAMGTVGHARGGPAKVAVISSGLMGTINGSGIANVVTVGQFTIPLMKRFGYPAYFAGAVEATSSMGGQIMPPVMGAVAFIMAETINVPYSTVCIAAIVPAVLYYYSAFWAVHLEAGKRGLMGLSKDQTPNPIKALVKNWYLLMPLAALVMLLFAGYTPLFAGTVGLGLTVMVIFSHPIVAAIPVQVLRVGFWIVLGISAAFFFEYGVWLLITMVLALMAVTVFVKGGPATLRIALDSLADGARHALPVGVACALVGTIIGTLTLTGAATNFVRVIVSVGEHSIFLSLCLTAITSLILGMGIPTIPNYIITSSIAAPALLHLGVPLIVSHMFVFYFGIMADLTPPVALAAFAAASIAKESGFKIGWTAVKIALPGWIVPFMAVYSPALMLQPVGTRVEAYGFAFAAAYMIVKAVIAVTLWGVTAIGYFLRPVGWPERIIAFLSAVLLVLEYPWTDPIGFVCCGAFVAYQIWRGREAKPAMTTAA